MVQRHISPCDNVQNNLIPVIKVNTQHDVIKYICAPM